MYPTTRAARLMTLATFAGVLVAASTGAGPAAAQKADLQLGGTGSGCSLTNITSKGCPPKIAEQYSNLKEKGAQAEKDMDQASQDIARLDPKDPDLQTKVNALMKKYSDAAATVARIKAIFGNPAPKDAIDYQTKLEKKDQDTRKKLEDWARSKFGCVPSFDGKILSCKFQTNALGGRK